MKTRRKVGDNNIIKKVATAILAVVVVVLLFVFADANLFHYTARLESDIASETLLTTVLYENGYVQPDTWYASTTPRVISVPNLAAFIYPLVSHNAILATGLACVLMMVILLVVMLIFYRQIGFSQVQAFAAVVLVMSFTNSGDEFQRMLFLYASYYVSHIITLFLILIFYNIWLRDNKTPIWTIALSLGIAVLNGMQGMHGCMFCYIPLLATEIIRRIVYFVKDKKQSNWFILIWTAILLAASFGTGKVLNTTNVSAGRNIRHAFSKFVGEVCPTIYSSLSLGRLLVFAYIILLASIAGYVIYVGKLITFAGKKFDEDTVYNYKAALSDAILESSDKTYRFWSMLVFFMGFLFCVFLETFTTADVTGRYFLMLLFVVATGFSLLLHQLTDNVIKRSIFTVLALIVVVYGSFSACVFYRDLIVNDSSVNSEEYQVYKWMSENEYSYGYTTFDFANSITVMGNNTVKVRAVNNMTDMAGCKWLSDKNWYPPVKSQEGETCYIVSQAMAEDFNAFLDTYEPNIVNSAEVGRFTVYVLDQDYTVWER